MEGTSINGFKNIGICGAGKMAVSFFDCIFPFGFKIIFYARNSEKLEQVRQRFLKSLSLKVKKRPEILGLAENVRFTCDISELGDTDVVFEFIAEDKGQKLGLIEKLLEVRKNLKQIIATGSSSLIPSTIYKDYQEINLIGVHFIYPVQYIKSVEIVYGEQSNSETIQKITDFVRHINKKPLLLNERVGSITTRVLINYQNEAFKINVSPWDIDRVVEQEGFIIPPFEIGDSAGLDIICNCITGHYGSHADFERFSDMKAYLEQKISKNHLGKKTDKGFFDYYKGKAIPPKSRGDGLDMVVLGRAVERLKLIYISSCLQLLDGCWINSNHLDEVFCELNQTDIGPVELAFNYGLENLILRLEEFESTYGAHFSPPPVLRYAGQNDLGRDEIDRQIRVFEMGGKRPDWYNKDFRYTI